jgi:Cu-Zn family superoxide dismutase
MVDEATYAICVLRNDDLGVRGIVRLTQVGEVTKLNIEFSGLAKGKHGFHIHEFGNLSNACVTAGGHYNPFGKEHGGPEDETRHVGDLGNIDVGQDGTYKAEVQDKLIKLTGPYSVIGRSIVVHQDEDDLGKGGQTDSKTTGHAGARLACGIIGISNKF